MKRSQDDVVEIEIDLNSELDNWDAIKTWSRVFSLAELYPHVIDNISAGVYDPFEIKEIVNFFPGCAEEFFKFLMPQLNNLFVDFHTRNEWAKLFPKRKITIFLSYYEQQLTCNTELLEDIPPESDMSERFFKIQARTLYILNKLAPQNNKSINLIVGILAINRLFPEKKGIMYERLIQLYPEYELDEKVVDNLYQVFSAVEITSSTWPEDISALVNTSLWPKDIPSYVISTLIIIIKAIEEKNLTAITNLVDHIRSIPSHQSECNNLMTLSIFIDRIFALELIDDQETLNSVIALNDLLKDRQIPSLWASSVLFFKNNPQYIPEGGIVIDKKGSGIKLSKAIDESDAPIDPLQDFPSL